jgi:lysophospholipase L1-like esterase
MDNKIARPVIIIWCTLIILFSLSFIKLPQIPYLNNYQSIDILGDIRESKKPPLPVIPKTVAAPVALQPTTKGLVHAVDIIDSSMITDYSADSAGSIQVFLKKLADLKHKKGKVRIAYFGDSFIEADYITGELRSRLQQMYGGNGVGFVPVQSIVADAYESIHFNKNNSWVDYNFHNNPKKYALGLTGHVFYSNGDAWCEYGALNNKFTNIYLYTGKTADTNTIITVDEDGVKNNITVNNNAYINQTALNNTGAIKKFKLSCASKNLPVYGVSIEDSTGVYVDNYGFRGNTGLLGLQVPTEVIDGFKKYFNYDLIIVHYGLNAVVHNDTNFEWFDRGITKLVQKIKSSYPGVPVLLVSTSDIAYNESGQYITDPAVPFLVQTQNETAKKNNVAFWNLYYSMGGANTIANWVDGDTVLAYKDYMHVNEKGADRIAGIFFNKLQKAQKN